MQGLADGYFVLPYTIGDYLADRLGDAPMSADRRDAFDAGEGRSDRAEGPLLSIGGTRSVDYFHRELGKLVWDYMRHGPRRDRASRRRISEIPALKQEFHKNVRVLGDGRLLNQSLEKAGRVADFFELAELMARDALARDESCGGHFREEHQTEEGEALRDDENFSHVAAWEWNGEDAVQTRHRRAARVQLRHPEQALLQVSASYK